ncbi:hypothetical protein WICMUC_002461 [Wickerhamomyces mucosus]|uniref:Succinate dehydrogenase [ubiquinone] cytochrome b small subunit n=1 Tax=Wickerhamomyces mucosus TaxID=1378264 RepID=A0A9P8TEY5_9ASCO|nr:hypothetical protein WICMUC_002461 [Wickerhamomyces mucosus]
MLSLTRVGLTSSRSQFAKSALLTGSRSFQTSNSQRFDIPFLKQIPQPPGYIVGNVNDAYVTPPSSRAHGSLHWNVERLISIGLVPLTIVPFVTGSFAPVLDATFSTLILAHSWIGFQACIIDYIPKRVYGAAHDYAIYLLSFGTLIAGYGIYALESKDVGLTGLLGKIFASKPEKK